MENTNAGGSDRDVPVDPEDAEDPGVAGGGGPAAVIYGEGDEEAEEHGDRLARDPDDTA